MILYSAEDNQWFTKGVPNYGLAIRDTICKIPAGTVMTYDNRRSSFRLIFQTLVTIDLRPLSDASLICYEMGSVVIISGPKLKYIPTLRFGCCRFPTESEYRVYLNSKTV